MRRVTKNDKNCPLLNSINIRGPSAFLVDLSPMKRTEIQDYPKAS